MKAQSKLILLVMTIVLFSPFAIDLYIATIPAISNYFGRDGGLSLSAYILALGVGQLFVGNIYDKYGPFKLMFWSIIGFVGTSIAIYYCQSFEQLIGLRAAQGFATSGVALTALALIKDNFTEKEGAKLYGYINSMMNVAPAVTPMLGAWIFEITGQWQALFIGLALYGIVVLPYVFATKKLPKWEAKYNKKVDWSFIRNSQYRKYGIAAIMSLGTLMLYVTIVSPLTQQELGFSEYGFSLYFGAIGLSMLGAGLVFGKLVAKNRLEDLFNLGHNLLFISVIASFAALIYAPAILASFILFCIAFIFLIASSTSLMLSELKTDTGKAVSIISASQMILGAILGASVSFVPLTLSESFGVVITIFFTYALFVRMSAKSKEAEKLKPEQAN